MTRRPAYVLDKGKDWAADAAGSLVRPHDALHAFSC